MATTSAAKPAPIYAQPNTVISISPRPLDLRHVVFTDAAGQQHAMDVAYYGRDAKGDLVVRVIETFDTPQSKQRPLKHVIAALEQVFGAKAESESGEPGEGEGGVGDMEVG